MEFHEEKMKKSFLLLFIFVFLIPSIFMAQGSNQTGYINGLILRNVTGYPSYTFSGPVFVQVIANATNSSNQSIVNVNGSNAGYSIELWPDWYNVSVPGWVAYNASNMTLVNVTANETTLHFILLDVKPTGNITGCVSVAGAPGRCGLPSISEDIFSAVEGFINFVAAFLASLVSGLIGLIYLFASVFAVVIFLIMFGLVFWVALWILKK